MVESKRNVELKNWRPLLERLGISKGLEGLHEGIPDGLRSSVISWLDERFVYYVKARPFDVGLTREYQEDLLRELERRLNLGLRWVTASTAYDSLRQQVVQDGNTGLAVLDFCLSKLDPNSTADAIAIFQLGNFLREGGSAYQVALRNDVAGLERRIDDGARAAGDQATAPTDKSSTLLAQAWKDVYGIKPNASVGYQNAVRSVEAIAWPIISPKNERATLGTMITDLRNAPKKWTVTMSPTLGQAVETLIAMMDLLWKGQHDRHGTGDDSKPLNVSQKEAEAAVHLATTLVQWFRSGVVARNG
jgi:hypothetical protein